MAENLKVKRYSNGDSITNVTDKMGNIDSAKWDHMKKGAYYIYNSRDSVSPNYNGKKIGFLYNWFVTNDPKIIAPTGWHIPTDSDWKELEMFVGMSKEDADKVNWRGTNEGNKLKITNDQGWNKPSNIYEVYGTYESGFSALGGGCVMYNGIFGIPGAYSTGFWWTASAQGDEASTADRGGEAARPGAAEREGRRPGRPDRPPGARGTGGSAKRLARSGQRPGGTPDYSDGGVDAPESCCDFRPGLVDAGVGVCWCLANLL